MTESSAPPGYYPDPAGGAGLRWWDGEGWSAHVVARGPWRDARPLVPYVVAALLLNAAAHAYLIVAYRGRVDVVAKIRRGVPGLHLAEARASDHDVHIAGLCVLVSYVVAGVVWLVWFKRTYGNAGTLRHLRDAKWAIWGWLVPFVALVLPPRMMNDIWKAGGGRASHSDRAGGGAGLVAVWWALVILSGLVSFSSLGVSPTTTTRDARLAALASNAHTATVGAYMAIAAALLAAVLVYLATTRLHARGLAVGAVRP